MPAKQVSRSSQFRGVELGHRRHRFHITSVSPERKRRGWILFSVAAGHSISGFSPINVLPAYRALILPLHPPRRVLRVRPAPSLIFRVNRRALIAVWVLLNLQTVKLAAYRVVRVRTIIVSVRRAVMRVRSAALQI